MGKQCLRCLSDTSLLAREQNRQAFGGPGGGLQLGFDLDGRLCRGESWLIARQQSDWQSSRGGPTSSTGQADA